MDLGACGMESNHDRRNRRKKWIKSVKVGDIVCDCQYMHSKVIALEHRYGGPLSWVKGMEWQDKAVLLENGMNCTLVNCASDPNHPWKHPSKTQMRNGMGDFWTDYHEKIYADWPD